MKNVVKSSKHFFGYFSTLETQCSVTIFLVREEGSIFHFTNDFLKTFSELYFLNFLVQKMRKGQVISKWFLEVVNFLKKTNENKSLSSKNELIRSFFGGNRWPQKSFRNKLTFIIYEETFNALMYLKVVSCLVVYCLL